MDRPQGAVLRRLRPRRPATDPNLLRPAEGLAYDPTRRTWRRLPTRPPKLKPASGSDGRAVWTGRELLVTGVPEADARGGMVGGAYNPVTNRWRLLPPRAALTGGGRRLQARTAVWPGTRLLVWNFWSGRPRAGHGQERRHRSPAGRVRRHRPVGLRPGQQPLDGPAGAARPDPPDGGRRLDGLGRPPADHDRPPVQARRRQRAGRRRGRPLRPQHRPLGPRSPTCPPPRPPPPGLDGCRRRRALLQRRLRSGRRPLAALPPEPDPAADPPLFSAGIERPLVHIDSPSSGGQIRLYVLEPAKPEP